MPHPSLTIDLDKIEHNARAIVGLCRQHGIAVTGVTKATGGNPAIASAMLRGGVSSIGESHIENIQRLQAAGVRTSYLLLQIPPLSAVDEVVESADVSLNSELAVLEGLSQAALRRGRVHEVVLMVDLGDLREGIWPDDLARCVRETLRLPGIRIKGLGTNLACFGAVAPSEDNMHQLVELAQAIEQTFGLRLEWISGANSSGLELIAAGRMPQQVTHARIGEAILLGRETIHRRPWPGTFQDAFALHAEVLELRKKPSVPIGERCEDAFGRLPAFEDRGEIVRALLNVGREDVDVDGIAPAGRGIEILGGSSDYLVADVTGAAGSLRVGNELTFSLNYGALLAAMTSEYVKKRCVSERSRETAHTAPLSRSSAADLPQPSARRLTRAFIHLDRLTHNLQLLQGLAGGRQLWPVIKGDAYGHGAPMVARHLVRLGYATFGVADVHEAIALREAGIDATFIILSATLPEHSEALVACGCEPVVCTREMVEALARDAQRLGRRVAVHLKVDTGMGRVGIRPDDVPAFLEGCRALPALRVRGLMSHFPRADEADKTFSKQQIEQFRRVAEAARGYGIEVCHMANSAAIFDLPDAYFDAVRPGIALYGLRPSAEIANPRVRELAPVLEWTTRITFLKEVPAGVGLSYGHAFRTQRPSLIATVPVGYADGLSRNLSNRLDLLVRGVRCPQVGRITMDMSLLDVTALRGQVELGNEAVIIGRQHDQEVTADELAETLGTINYEVVSIISHRVPRVVVDA